MSDYAAGNNPPPPYSFASLNSSDSRFTQQITNIQQDEVCGTMNVQLLRDLKSCRIVLEKMNETVNRVNETINASHTTAWFIFFTYLVYCFIYWIYTSSTKKIDEIEE